jgi:2,3-diphosphopglycerate-independent phosphoglycerate mutase
MIAPTAIIKGFGITVGLDIIDVPGTTGDEHSDHEAKYVKAIEVFESGYNFGFVHIKAVDDMAHDKHTDRRIALIEKIDGIIGRHLAALAQRQQNFVLVFTGDHTTTAITGEHTFEPVPFVISSLDAYVKAQEGELASVALKDDVTQYDELACAKGSLGRFPAHRIFQLIKSFKAKIGSL